VTVTYSYARGKLPSGEWDIDHPERLHENGTQKYLAQEVEAALPGLAFVLEAHEDDCFLRVERELSGDEKALVDGLVAHHRSNA